VTSGAGATVGKIVRLCVALLLLALGACAGRPSSYVVLLDNPDGHASRLTLSNEAGSATLDQPGQAVGAGSRSSAPSDTFNLTMDEMRQNFGRAMDAAPPVPLIFTLYFQFDTTDLTDESRRRLPDVLAAVSQRPAPEVSIVGHADNVGSPEINNQLALRRAEAVRRALLGVGVESRLIEVASHGANNPAVPQRRGIPEPRNRRVEVTVR
jgi:outer membrane protein OmpA-like peptidoglycan-associated protein